MAMFEEDQRVGGVRERQKLETRERVIEAARALFQEAGYEQATIRDIASRAGVAPGSVFTTFASKAELLQEIVFRRLEELFAAIRADHDDAALAEERLRQLAHAAYRTEFRELRLLADNIGASWTWPVEAEMANRVRMKPLFDIMMGILRDGVSRGELRGDVDLALAVDVLFACYLRAFRKAIFDGWDAAKVAEHLAAQMRLVLDGCRP